MSNYVTRDPGSRKRATLQRREVELSNALREGNERHTERAARRLRDAHLACLKALLFAERNNVARPGKESVLRNLEQEIESWSQRSEAEVIALRQVP